MRDHVVYNNPDTVGEIVKTNPLSIFTKKKVSEDVIGDRVWLITSAGSPRKYFLRCWFIINDIEVNPARALTTCLSGSEGNAFDTMLEINGEEEWFKVFKKSQGNFAFGFNTIKEPETIEQLETLAGI